MLRSASTGFIFVLILLATSVTAGAQANVFTLTASPDYAIDDVPVSVVWDGPLLDANTPICLVYSDGRTPGQVELTPEGEIRIWFMANISAGDSQEYEIMIGENCAEAYFEWIPSGSQATELRYNGTSVLEYVHPKYNPANVTETKKPFHMVYAPDGSRTITKGIGGLYTHHRGIFFGYNNISFAGASGVDVWHANAGAYPEHREIIAEWTGPVSGGHVAIIDWIHNGTVFITETRRVWAFKRSDGELIIDFHSTLESHVGDVVLDGDNHHAGVQFRAAQYVADNTGPSRFIRPEGWEHLNPFGEHDGELEMPWNAFQFIIEDEPYTVGYLTNPIINPEGTRPREMSERRYGRFGEFIPTILPGDGSLDFKYRFWISNRRDEMTRDELHAQYVNYLIFDSTPQVVGSATPWSGQASLNVEFVATSRFGLDIPEIEFDDSATTFEWHFGDGHTAVGERVSHTYETEGEFAAHVIARHPFGKVAVSTPIRIVVGNTAPEPQIMHPPVGAVYDPNRPMRLIGSGFDPEDGTLPDEALTWEILVGDRILATGSGSEWVYSLPSDDITNWHGEATFTVRLTVSDSGGLSQSTEQIVRYARLQAQVSDVMHGFALTPTDDIDGEMHASTSDERAYLAFDPLNLEGRAMLFVRAKSDAGALLSVRTGGPDGELIQFHAVSPNNAWELAQIPIPSDTARNAGLYVVVETLHQGEVAINWLQLVGAGLPQ